MTRRLLLAAENGARLYSNTIVAEGGPYVFSCYLKAGTLTQAKLTIADGNGSSVRAYAQPSLGADWQRYVVLLGATTAGSTLRVELYPGKFDKETGYVWAWGAQLENGSVATSYATGDASTPADTTPPATPVGLTATVEAGAVQLRWTANGESDLAKYRLERGPNSTSFTTLAEPTTAEHRDSSVSAGLTYYYRLAAVDASGNASAYSNPVSVSIPVPPDTTAPVISAIVAGSITANGVLISWSTNEPADTQVEREELVGGDVRAPRYHRRTLWLISSSRS
mgnify:CR=1 FL=1